MVWRAGRSAAALRAAALNCLLTILIGRLLKTQSLLSLASDIASGCIGLLDDQYYLNRLYGAKCLGELAVSCEKNMDIMLINRTYPGILLFHYISSHLTIYVAKTKQCFHLNYIELLKRLDDETKDVRLAAAEALAKIYNNLPPDYTVKQFEAYFDHVVGVLIVHLDDRDEAIQDGVSGKLSCDFNALCGLRSKYKRLINFII